MTLFVDFEGFYSGFRGSPRQARERSGSEPRGVLVLLEPRQHDMDARSLLKNPSI